jgi:multidrug efflux system outer membrane protein
MMGPTHERKVDSTLVFTNAIAGDSSLAERSWTSMYADPNLQTLIKIALDSNADLRIAAARIDEANALLTMTNADLAPKVDASVGARRGDLSNEVFPDFPGGYNGPRNIFNMMGSVSWEADIWGKLRSASAAQRAELAASNAGYRAAQIEIVSAVAAQYVNLLRFDTEVRIQETALKSRVEYVRLAKLRFEGGKTSELDYRQAESEAERVRSFIANAKNNVEVTENAINVLTGRAPGTPIARAAEVRTLQMPTRLPAGLPSTLIDRRPDVIAAEQRLIAANARIGVAKAMLFPQLSLTGEAGWASTDLSTVVTSNALQWSVGANLLQPIFNFGKNIARIESEEARAKSAVESYRGTILTAFREVNDALVTARLQNERREARTREVEARQRVLSLSEKRYLGGVDVYLQVLDAQRYLLDAQIEEVRAVADQYNAVIGLYRALGGGVR